MAYHMTTGFLDNPPDTLDEQASHAGGARNDSDA